MTNNPQSSGNSQPNEDALAALRGMQSAAPADSVEASHEPAAPDTQSSPSSTGLVGMLSQGQVNAASPDLGGSSRSFASGVPIGVPQPKAAGSGGPAPKRAGKFDKIGVAREITLPANGADVLSAARDANQSPARPMRRIAKPPAWWGAAIPVMYTVSSLLMVISFWAIGAVVAMIAGFQAFPLMDAAEEGGFTQTSKAMAVVMLFSLPISIAIGIMAIMLGRKIKAYEHKMAAAAEAES